MMTQIRNFSNSYYVIDSDVVNYSGERVVACNRLYNGLTQYVNHPFVHLDGAHYELHPEGAVPAETIAVPEQVDHKEDSPVLLAKEGAPLQ